MTVPEQVAEGVWIVRGGHPKRMNVYLVREGDGVLAFDAGIAQMVEDIRDAAYALGGLTRVVLGHGHADHRGAAPFLGVPVLCHPDAVEEAEGPPLAPYQDLAKLPPPVGLFYRFAMPFWGKTPAKIDDTIADGNEVAGFKAVLLAGHAPGQIALWRESDRLALTTDIFYTVDSRTGLATPPRVPHPAWNMDHEGARAAMRTLAEMEPREAWPGHAKPVREDVKAKLIAGAAH